MIVLLPSLVAQDSFEIGKVSCLKKNSLSSKIVSASVGYYLIMFIKSPN